MSIYLKDYSPEDQKKMRAWMDEMGGAADMSMAISALKVKPVTQSQGAAASAVNPTPAVNLVSAANPLVTQKGTTQYVTPFTDREQQGFDTWYNMLAGTNPMSLPDDIAKSIRAPYERAGESAYKSSIGNLSEFTGGRLNSWAAKAAADSKQDYALKAEDAISNARMQYAQMLLGGMQDYTGAVSGRDDTAYGRDFTERQQDLSNQLAIGEATGILPGNIMNVNNPWIKDGKAMVDINYQALINAKQAVNPNDPDIPLLNQARNLKIQQNPEQFGKYADTMSSGAYETLSGKIATSDMKAKEAEIEYNNAKLELAKAEMAYEQDPSNPANRARIMSAQASLNSAAASLSNASTNRAELDWKKNPENPEYKYKLAQATGQGTEQSEITKNEIDAMFYSLPPADALRELNEPSVRADYIERFGRSAYDSLKKIFRDDPGVTTSWSE